MPFSDYSILQTPYVAVTLTGAVTDFTALQEGYNFGTVDSINYLCDKAVVGDAVLFKQTEAKLITAGGVDYYIITDDNLFFKQIVPP
jgi:hypothetical protein